MKSGMYSSSIHPSSIPYGPTWVQLGPIWECCLGINTRPLWLSFRLARQLQSSFETVELTSWGGGGDYNVDARVTDMKMNPF